MTEAEITPTTALAVALAAVEVFRKECRSDIGSPTISCFLQIAIRREIPMFDLIQLLDVSNAAVSRNVALLGQGSPKEPGMGLVEAYEDAYFRRRKIVRITQKGSALMEKVVAAINNMRGA
jgi:DNA-binding MarR family transcriptional regulator